MPEEMKPAAPVAEVEETKAETEQIKAASSVTGLIAFCITHPVQTIAILLVVGLVIGFSLSGWKVGAVEKSAVELRK